MTTSWNTHQYKAEQKALKILKKRDKGKKSLACSQEKTDKLKELLQTAPVVLNVFHEWNNEKTITEKDYQRLSYAESVFYKKMLFPQKKITVIFTQPSFYLMSVLVLFYTICFTAVFFNLYFHWSELKFPVWAAGIFIWIILSMEWNGILRILNMKYPPSMEAIQIDKMNSLANQGKPFAQMLKGQINQGFQPTIIQWRTFNKWAKMDSN